MSLKEYIVTLNKNIDYDQFWQEMENPTSGLPFIPDRAVQIADFRPGSERSTHYYITDSEAELLKQDPRVLSVEIPPSQDPFVRIGFAVEQNNNFSKTTSSSSPNVNWGLVRMNSPTNIYGVSTTTSEKYRYTLDGTGVDVVIVDSGIEVDHPEFRDAYGVSRVQQIDWYVEADKYLSLNGLVTYASQGRVQHNNHYRDYSGHGTHVAGIVAGRIYGWAKNARIYSLKMQGLEGPGDLGTGIIDTDMFDLIRLWHLNKPIDPATGKKRPTIVNASVAYLATLEEFLAYNNKEYSYRGAALSPLLQFPDVEHGMLLLGTTGSVLPPLRITSIDADVDDLIAAGVQVCIAAGNSGYKMDVPGGQDYNNYLYLSGTTNPTLHSTYQWYYHRGESPHSDGAIKVGNIDSQTRDSRLDQRAYSSVAGPGVDIWAPGTNILSASSTITNIGTPSPYRHGDTNYKQINITGTSMAAPQIAGLCALYLQVNPDATPAQVKSWLISNAKTNVIYSTGSNNDYDPALRSLLGGPARFAYNPLSNYSLIVEQTPTARTNLVSKTFSAPGVYEITIPGGVKPKVTYHLWGAGGGGGGSDGNGPGGPGAAGAYSTGTFTVSAGDVLQIAIGEGGRGGGSSTGGGSGRGGHSLSGYSGARGGNAGGAGWSGGGAGGGGATVISVNGSVLFAAGGGGGGGGGSHNRGGASGSNSQTTVSSGSQGGQGQDMPGDGGGGGGGGGGLRGGTGGAYGPDNSTGGRGGYTGSGGQPGSGTSPTGTSLSFWSAPAAQGGGTGQSGGSGLALLQFELLGLGKTKIGGEWRNITDAYVKINGTWRPITGAFIRSKGKWQALAGLETALAHVAVPGAYGP